MKCYTLDAGRLSAGINLLADGCVPVGEPGRGRKLVLVPLPPGAEVAPGSPRPEPARLLAVPGDGVVVLVHDHSGYRGSWRLRAARPSKEWATIVARAANHRPPDGEGPLAEGHELYDPPLCAACDAVCGESPTEAAFTGQILARGACAQGDAGRMGGGPAYLLVLRGEQAVELVRSGRLYGEPGVIRLGLEGGEPVVSDPRAVAESARACAAW